MPLQKLAHFAPNYRESFDGNDIKEWEVLLPFRFYGKLYKQLLGFQTSGGCFYKLYFDSM